MHPVPVRVMTGRDTIYNTAYTRNAPDALETIGGTITMWYVYFTGDSWKDGIAVSSELDAREIVNDSNGMLSCQYVQ